MAQSYDRRINLYINIDGKQVNNNVKSIRGEMSKLVNSQNQMTIGSQEYMKASLKIRSLKGILDQHAQDIGKLQTPIQKLISKAKELLPALGFAALAMGFKQIITKADEMFTKYQERVDNLSALTGMTGDELEWLAKKAKETSVSTVEGNVRIKQSAESIVDAYTKVGSKRPELLKVKEDLANVTQEAIILSEAAKSELDPAVSGLTMSLNQFNLGADQSRRIINILAAGSKAGAGDIPYLTAAMEKSGTTANLMGISIEQWAGLVESIAPYYEQASTAGNSFDKVLLKLKEKQIGYNNGVFDMSLALDQLKAMYDAGTSSADIFGAEHSKMGELLVIERSKVDEYTKAVTGSSVAIEQASKNTNNEAGKRAQAQNGINNLYLEFGQKIAPIITKGITGGVELIKVAIKYSSVLIPLIGALVTYTVAAKAKVLWDVAMKGGIIMLNVVQALFTGNILAANNAMKLLNLTTKLNPFTLIASLIVAAGIALFSYSKRVKEVTALHRAEIDIRTESIRQSGEEIAALNILFTRLKNNNEKGAVRNGIIQEINDKYGIYLPNLLTEKSSLDDIQTAYEGINTAMKTKIELEVKEAKAKEIYSKLYEKQLEYDRLYKLSINDFNSELGIVEGVKGAYKERYLDKMDTEIEELTTIYNKLTMISPKNLEPGELITPGGTVPKVTVNPLNPKGIEIDPAIAKAAADALDLAYKQQQLTLKQKYEGDETIQKEYHVRMLANELAFLKSKLEITADESLRVDLKSQIIDKELLFTAALKEATPELMLNRDQINQRNVSLLEEAKLLGLASQKQTEGAASLEEYTLKQQIQVEAIQGMTDIMSGYLSDALSGSIDQYQTFGDTLILMSLQMLKMMVPIWSAMILGYSLADPISVATVGVKGMINFAVVNGLLLAGISAVEGVVKGGIDNRREAATKHAAGGFTHGETTYIAGEEGKEWIAPNWMTTHPLSAPIIANLEDMRRNPITVSSGAIEASKMTANSTQFTSSNSSVIKPISNQHSVDQELKQILKEQISSTNKLNAHLAKGIRASVNKYGVNGLDDSIKDISDFKSKNFNK